MKTFLHLLAILLFFPYTGHSQFACAGLDRVDIYLNSKLLATSTFADAPTIKLDTLLKSDTIILHAYTNWEGLRNCTLDVKDESGELMDHINSASNTGYEALFTYIFIRADIDDPELKSFDMFLNLLCERTVETEQITTFNLTGK
jgi:hypothetical protein